MSDAPLTPELNRLPLVGDVDNRFRAPNAQINDPRFGESEGMPFVLEINVDKERSAPANVGRLVDQTFFAQRPPLLFNVSFACGKPRGIWRTGTYGDPRSHWFNVFFGYYEIDVDKAQWGRPFGYQANLQQPEPDDLVRIGKSDWNYFSNWLYGVPDASIAPHNDLQAVQKNLGRTKIGAREWDTVELDECTVVSSYVSGRDSDPKLVDREAWSLLWRASFGFPLNKEVTPETSFFGVPMRGKFYMSFREKKNDNDLGKTAYQTFMFGGTINRWWERQGNAAEQARRKQFNEDFLEAQLKAVRQVIATDYADLGF